MAQRGAVLLVPLEIEVVKEPRPRAPRTTATRRACPLRCCCAGEGTPRPVTRRSDRPPPAAAALAPPRARAQPDVRGTTAVASRERRAPTVCCRPRAAGAAPNHSKRSRLSKCTHLPSKCSRRRNAACAAPSSAVCSARRPTAPLTAPSCSCAATVIAPVIAWHCPLLAPLAADLIRPRLPTELGVQRRLVEPLGTGAYSVGAYIDGGVALGLARRRDQAVGVAERGAYARHGTAHGRAVDTHSEDRRQYRVRV
eukprot:scaffold53978_cov63-Phaeocystis_antarctica.AAC.2